VRGGRGSLIEFTLDVCVSAPRARG